VKVASIFLLVAALLIAGCSQHRQKADLVIHGGPIFSAQANNQIYQAIAIKDGKIVSVGDEQLVRQVKARQIIDLNGRLAMPGFNDAHSHMRGRAKRYIDLSAVKSIAELQAQISNKVAQLPAGEWITGYGWSEDRFAERRKPTRVDLDTAAPDNPVFLDREGGHSGVANTKALTLAGLTSSSPDPEGGQLEKMADGSLSGIIRENLTIVSSLVPDAEPAELRADLAKRLNALFSLGITSVTDASTSVDDYRSIWRPLYANATQPLPRATVQINPDLVHLGPEGAIAALASLGAVTGSGTEFLRIGAVKIFVDGGFTGPAAWTTKGYRNDSDYHGAAAVDLQALEIFSAGAHKAGWQLGYHAIGDLAIKRTVEMFDRILTENPRDNHRHHVNHFSVLPDDASLWTMARQQIGIIQQPNFTYSLEDRYRTYLPNDALAHNNAIQTPLGFGIKMAFSSDIIPIDPRVGIYAAVTRAGLSGAVYGPDEAIDVPLALQLYTAGGAWMNFRERQVGQIAPGMAADIIIIDRDLLSVSPRDILVAKVDMTFANGKIVFDRAEQGSPRLSRR
jgi:hypothetical protein